MLISLNKEKVLSYSTRKGSHKPPAPRFELMIVSMFRKKKKPYDIFINKISQIRPDHTVNS